MVRPEEGSQMFTSIVVGTDGSERAARAVEQAAELAKVCGATLHVVNAYKGIDMAVAAAMAAGSVVATAPDLSRESKGEADAVRQALESGVEQFRADGIAVETHAITGSPVSVLLDLAETVGADLVVVGNRGMTGGRRILGSVPNTLAHNARCTVLIVQTDDEA
jgi:nucleotide-binding universal stress UspA family protein